MAVLQLVLDIDSEVYPELYAALQAVRHEAARGERVRQLAATGLVWETVRVHGAAVARLPGVPAAVPHAPAGDGRGAAAPARPTPAPSDEDDWIPRRSAASAQPAAASAPRTPAVETSPFRTDRLDRAERTVRAPNGLDTAPRAARTPARAASPRTDFIDLALNAAPAPGHGAPSERLHLPLLVDAVVPPDVAAPATPPRYAVPITVAVAMAADDADPAEASPAAAVAPTVDAPAEPAAATVVPVELPAAAGDETAAPAAPEEPAPVRSRLRRMNAMGLFRNG